MKSTINIAKILTLLLVLYSCTDTNNYIERVEALSVESALYSKIISIEGKTELYNPQSLLNINDAYLVVLDLRDKGIFQVFEIPSLEFLYSWGRQGGGPDEFETVFFPSVNVSDDMLILYDPGRQRLRYFTVKENEIIRVKEHPISHIHQRQPLNGLRRLNDSLYVAFSHWTEFPDKEFVALKPGNDEVLFTFGEYPDMSMEPQQRYQSYSKFTASKPDGTKLIAFYGRHNLFKIFDRNGLKIKKVIVDDRSLPPNVSNEFIYRISAYATDSYIYTLALNAIEKDIMQNPELLRPTIEIWDWEGMQVSRHELDRLITHFTVCENLGKLYGLSVYSMHEIYEFDLF